MFQNFSTDCEKWEPVTRKRKKMTIVGSRGIKVFNLAMLEVVTRVMQVKYDVNSMKREIACVLVVRLQVICWLIVQLGRLENQGKAQV